MKFKKVKLILLAAGCVVAGCLLFNKINVGAVDFDSVKQNVVYTETNSEDESDAVSSKSCELNSSEDKIVKEKSEEALQKYFGFSDEDFDGIEYNSVIIDENTLADLQKENQEQLDAEYDNGNGDLSEESYESHKNQIVENNKAFKERLDKLKHGYIQVTWYDEEFKHMYMMFLNENSKEVEEALILKSGDESDQDEDLNLSEEEKKNIADEFIKDNNLAGIKNVKFIYTHNSFVYCEDENDAGKKAAVCINKSTGKVDGFYTDFFAEEMYERIAEAVAEK